MIAIIADDLSGATELASIAYARGLSVEVQTVFDPATGAEVVAVDTDSRSLPAEAAAQRVGEIARRILKANPEWVYKKTDSVLRGRIRAEITALLAVLGKTRALFVPANPGRKRMIRGGSYFVDGTPLDQTVFAKETEYPATSSNVRQLLSRDPGAELHLAEEAQLFPLEGIVVPDTAAAADLAAHAARADTTTLCAGAGEFFDALLAARSRKSDAGVKFVEPSATATTLLVCGSATAWPVRCAECERRGIPVFPMPEKLAGGGTDRIQLVTWASEVAHGLGETGSALVAIGTPAPKAPVSPAEWVETLARVVPLILEATRVDHLLLEGGATASALLRQFNGTRLALGGLFGPGLGAFQIVGTNRPILAIKPGSYPWPEGWVKRQYRN